MGGAFLLANPGGGRGRVGRRLAELRALAARRGLEVHTSSDVADLLAQVRGAVVAGAERLLVAGGDGTLHYGIQAVAQKECALGMLPLGSGNDLAASFGVPSDLSAALDLALDGPVRRVDAARWGDRFFGGVAGVGFDSQVNKFANERVKRLRGSLIYVYATLRVLAGFQPPRLRVAHDGGVFDDRAMFAAFANTRRYGGGMYIAPNARPDDGLLDVIVVRAISKLALLRVFPKVFKGKHLAHPAVVELRTRRAEVSLDRTIVAYGDGEPLLPVGELPVPVEAVPGALHVIGGPGDS
ncbi:MAG: diacylglycerol/lipid kinase family protein [Acidobacteriota bacterium]